MVFELRTLEWVGAKQQGSRLEPTSVRGPAIPSTMGETDRNAMGCGQQGAATWRRVDQGCRPLRTGVM